MKKVRGSNELLLSYNFFSHPDYTVGFGISPNQLLSQVADYTAGGESHPAPKNDIYLFVNRISHFASYCNIFMLSGNVHKTVLLPYHHGAPPSRRLSRADSLFS